MGAVRWIGLGENDRGPEWRLSICKSNDGKATTRETNRKNSIIKSVSNRSHEMKEKN